MPDTATRSEWRIMMHDAQTCENRVKTVHTAAHDVVVRSTSDADRLVHTHQPGTAGDSELEFVPGPRDRARRTRQLVR